MKITATRADLLTALKRTGAAINPSYTPARASVLLVAEAGYPERVFMGATDGVLGVDLRLLGSAKELGRALLPHKRLTAIVTELPEGGTVEISVDSKFHASIKSPTTKRKFTMTGHDPADYPAVLTSPIDSGTTSFALDSKSLSSAASDVKQSIDPSRINGAFIEPDGKKLFRMIAAHTSLSIASGELVEAETSSLQGILLPTVLLDAASAFGGKSETIVAVQEDETRVHLVGDGCRISCAKLYSPFPDWWRQALDAIPKEKLFRCSAERFLESVRAVSVAADVEGAVERFIQIDVRYQNGECLVSTRASSKNYGEDELPVTGGALGQPPVVMHLDGQRLSLALRAAAPGDVDVYFDLMISQETFFLKGDAFVGMFMPVRVVDVPAPK